ITLATTAATTFATCSESRGTNPCEANDNVPDFTARLQYDAPGGHKFQLSGVLRNLRVDDDLAAGGITGSDSEIGWGLLGAASINLGDIATLTAMATYGDGIGSYVINGANASALVVGTAGNPDIDTIEIWSVVAALAIGMTDTTTFNVAVGFYDQKRSDSAAGQIDDLVTVHANIIWQPVSRFRMGIEGMWGQNDLVLGPEEDALRFQFGAWFFF
ncbi:MAG: porin, partial [Hyphomicrobiales bacterium]